ncbi:cytokine receptor common subunit gamma-like isoform X2 [Heterodontus francisci]|uniref:cytokine receptor common subunit gamma-like isoform X2 n=1 Tax=Heterodontus francisci TaxID=7792 RepID=UPI00355C23BF
MFKNPLNLYNNHKMACQCLLKSQVLPEMIYWIWLIVLCNVALSMQSDDVNCIVYNEEFMECTWSHSEGKPNYTLYHWYLSQPAKECRNYIQQDGYNIGCNFSKNEIVQFQEFNIYRNGSNDSGNVPTPIKTFQLQNQVKPNPPGNLTVNVTINNELFLSWEAPMKQMRCLMYGIRHRSNKDKGWQRSTINEQTKFNLPSVDPEKLYTFQVQSKINQYCGTTDLWSEWSLPVYWGKNDTHTENATEGLRTLITGLSLLGLILLVLALTKSERLKVIIIPKIPNPGRSFDPLFNNHNGNFQDWLGVPKDTLEGFKSNYHENVCIVSESPADSTQSSDTEGSYEQLGRTQIPGKASIPGNKGEIQPKNSSPAMLFSDIAVFVESSRYGINENIYVRV